MSVKRTKTTDPDLGGTTETVRIDFQRTGIRDARAIEAAMEAHHPLGKLVSVFKAFQKLPEDLPESEQFVELFIRLANDHTDGKRQVRHADIAECRRLLERAKRRHAAREARHQRSDAGGAPKRLEGLERLLASWRAENPKLTAREARDRLEGIEIIFERWEISERGGRVYQVLDYDGKSSSVSLSSIGNYLTRIRNSQ